MTDLSLVDCNGLNGSLAFGFVTAGFDLRVRTGYYDLGRYIVNANRGLWGDDWVDAIDTKSNHANWRDWPMPERGRVIIGVPPCSGFSILAAQGSAKSVAHARGPDNPINACMVSTVRYAARHRPDVVLFESVTGAYQLGRQLMLEMRASLEILTRDRYTLTHYLHDGMAMGSPTSRKRYMFIAVKGDDPFVVEPAEEATEYTTMRDAIGDLETLAITKGDQPITRPDMGGDWAAARRRWDGQVDGQHHRRPGNAMICNIAGEHGVEWKQGASFTQVMQALYAKGGKNAVAQALSKDPDSEQLARLIDREFNVGAFGQRREVYDSSCSLITGAGPNAHVHPSQPRSMTLRELARVQGWPDDLRIDYDTRVYGEEKIEAVWGKAVGITVSTHAGQQVREWLEGDVAGKTPGQRIGDREWLIDHLDAAKRVRHMALEARREARAGQVPVQI
jgi:site-specific DNA-cytosine methylase